MKRDPNNQQLDENQDTENSVLDQVLSESRTKEINTVRPSKIALSVLDRLKERERDILIARYGLSVDNINKETLEGIGQRLAVTRERVRQIEKAALKKIGEKYTMVIKPLWKIIEEYRISYKGIISLEYLADYLQIDEEDNKELEQNALRLVMAAHSQIKPLKKDSWFREGWIDKTLNQDRLVEIQQVAVQILDRQGRSITEERLVKAIVDQMEGIDQPAIKGTLRVSSKLGMDNKGNWGLVSWPTVVPRRIRDKVFIIMEEINKPLHFKEITRLIQERFKTSRPTLNRTVHNELIGDKRFVLVGRGIYALKSWGYKPGVVSDVIKEVLHKAGQPLHISEIIEAVMKSRQVKRNTVVANLQDRSLFKKVDKATYTLVLDNETSSKED